MLVSRSRNSAPNNRRFGLIAVIVIVVAAIAVGGMVWFNQRQAQQKAAQEASVQASRRVASSKKKRAAEQSSKLAEEMAADPTYQAYHDYGLTYAMIQKAKTMQVTAIGDSVMESAAYGLKSLFPQGTVDAAVSRQAYDTAKLIEAAKSAGTLAPVVIIGLGTNGTITPANLADAMKAAGKRHVYWITPYSGDPWDAENQALLRKAPKTYPNLTIIDWAKLLKEKGDKTWLSPDGVHPDVKGEKYYYTYIAKRVLETEMRKK